MNNEPVCPACQTEVAPAPDGLPLSPGQALDYHIAGCPAALCPTCEVNVYNCWRMLQHGDQQDVTTACNLLHSHARSCHDTGTMMLLINSGHAHRAYARRRIEQMVDGLPLMAVKQN